MLHWTNKDHLYRSKHVYIRTVAGVNVWASGYDACAFSTLVVHLPSLTQTECCRLHEVPRLWTHEETHRKFDLTQGMVHGEAAKGFKLVPCDFDGDELALVDTTGDGHVTEMSSKGAMDDAGEGDGINGEGFLPHFFDLGTEVGGA